MTGLVSVLITLLILGLIVGLCFWIIDLMPIIPAPFKNVAKAIIALVCLLYLLSGLFHLGGVGLISIN